MKKWIALMIFCICSMTIGAQNVKTIRGHVSDEKGHDVKAASIIADDGHTATVSNENGYFILNVPEKTHTITVSHLGYLSEILKVGEKTELSVRLHSKAVMLQDVLVADAEDVLKIAIQNIPKNYVMEPQLYDCFYRETTCKGRRFIYVAEAVMQMYKMATDCGIDFDKVAIGKARRLISTQANDTLGAKIAGGPTTPLILDIVKNRDYLLNDAVLSQYKFSMRPAPTTTDGRSEVIVTIEPYRVTEEALLWGDFYIDTETMAIRQVNLQLDMKDRSKAERFMLQQKPVGVRFKPQQLNIQLNYRPDHQGKLFLGYIRSDIAFKCDWKRRLFSAGYRVTSEMVVTDVKVDGIKPIKGRNSFRKQESLYDHPEYFGDADFWQKYNIIAPTETLLNGIKKFMKREK